MKPLVIFSFILLTLFSCKKENDPALILISPSQFSFVVHSSDILTFNINCSSNSNLKSLVITSKTETTFTQTILDSAISSKAFEFNYEYKVPVVFDSTKITLVFTLTDVDGNKNSIAKVLYVSSIYKNLTETSGHIMYSHCTTNFDAYNLLTALPIHSNLTDSSLTHIMDASIDSVNHNTLSRKWISPAELNFVKFNTFDYANATTLSLKNAYIAGLKDQFVSNIVDGDIILTKLGNPAIDSGFVAIKVISVIDADSTLNDKYIFNIKK